MDNMRVALIFDYLMVRFGGGQRVLSALCESFPDAPIFTLLYDEKSTGGAFKSKKIQTSFLQKIPGFKKYYHYLIPLMPLAIEQFDLSGFDMVVSASHSFGKGVITKPGIKHICYCFTPTRYLWHEAGLPFRPLSQFLLTYLRSWDFQAAQRPDYFIACSETVKQRIKKYYNRESEVIYPPVETGRFFISDSLKNYFLMVGRLVPYKRFDIAVETFSKLPKEKLLIIGNGPESKKLEVRSKKLGVKNIKFLGSVSDNELSKHYANCKALIFPQEEDFGIVPIEAMASGRPVIAYRAGGTLETIIENETGIFFYEQTSESLAKAIKNFDDKKFNSEKIKQNAQKFNKEVFRGKIQDFMTNLT